MSNEVGVEPGQVKAAASALEKLRDALEKHVPVIVKTMNNYWSDGIGTPLDLKPLHKAHARSSEDAANMRARYNAAMDWLNQHSYIPNETIAYVPWDGKALDAADARYEAQALSEAESDAGSNPQFARQQIKAIEADIQDHIDSGDKQWLQDFYNKAGPSVVNLAQTLHDLDKGNPAQNEKNKFEVLTKDDQKILKTYGTGLALADKAGLSPDAVQTYGNPSNAWSAAMLVKFGPDGSKWAVKEPKCAGNPDGKLSLLAMMTNKVYEEEKNGTLKMPVGFGGYTNYDAQDRDKLAGALSSFDPLTAMMKADAQNKDASWQVMGGKDGNGLAQILLNARNGDLPNMEGRWLQDPKNDKGQRGEYFTMLQAGNPVPQKFQDGQIIFATPDQKVVGSFLDASTSAPRGHDDAAMFSAYAAKNIIDNTPKGSDIQEAPAVQTALLHTAQRYLLDLSESTTYNGPSSVLPFDSQQGNPYVLKINGLPAPGSGKSSSGTPLSMFLNQILSNPHDAGVLRASVSTTMGRYYALGQTSGFPKNGPGSPDKDMAALLGRINTESGNIHFSAGQQKDEQAAETNSLISFASSAATWIPVAGNYISKAESVATLFGVPMDLPTDHAANAATASGYDFAESETNINVPMVQALIKAHAIPPEALKNQPWLVDGKIVLSDKSVNGKPSTAAAFSSWWDKYNSVHHLSDKEGQYQHAMELQQSLDKEKG